MDGGAGLVRRLIVLMAKQCVQNLFFYRKGCSMTYALGKGNLVGDIGPCASVVGSTYGSVSVVDVFVEIDVEGIADE